MSALHDEVRVAAAVIDHLRAAGIDEDDLDFAALVLAETDVLDRLRRIVWASRRIEADVEALAAIQRDLAARKARFEDKREALRRVVLGAMEALGLARLDDPAFTVALARGRPGVSVTDEAALPDDLCVVSRRPDKARIAEALRAGPVPGAALTNGAPTLTVRTR